MANTAIRIAELLIPQAPRPRVNNVSEAGAGKGLLAEPSQSRARSHDGDAKADENFAPEPRRRTIGDSKSQERPDRARSRVRENEDGQDPQNGDTREVRLSFAAILELLAAGEDVQIVDSPFVETATMQTEATGEQPAIEEDVQIVDSPFVQSATMQAETTGEQPAIEIVVPGQVLPGANTAEAGGPKAQKLVSLMPTGGEAAGTGKAVQQSAAQSEAVVQTDVVFAQPDTIVQAVANAGQEGKTVQTAKGNATEGTAEQGLPAGQNGQVRVTAADQRAVQLVEGGSEAASEAARGRTESNGVAASGGDQTGQVRISTAQGEQTSAAVHQTAHTAEAVSTARGRDSAEQPQQNGPQASARHGEQTPQAIAAQQGETSDSNGGAQRGDSGEAAEQFQAALNKAAGPEAQVSVSGRSQRGEAQVRTEATEQVAVEPPVTAGQSQASQTASNTSGVRSPAAQLAETVAETVNSGQARAGRQLTVRLNPPELGSVRITFESDGEQLRGVLEVSNPRTLGELQRELPALMNRLIDSGVQMRRMDLNLADNASSNSHLPDFGNSQSEGQGHASTGANASAEANAEQPVEATTAAVAPGSEVTDDALNVWI